MFDCLNFFWYGKSFLVDVTVAERGQVGKGVQKRIPHMYGHIHVGFFLIPFPGQLHFQIQIFRSFLYYSRT